MRIPFLAALAVALSCRAVSARPQNAEPCPDAKELERSFELTVVPAGGVPVVLKFEYSGCDAVPRNDLQAPYTERDYDAPGGFGLTIVTDDGRDFSDVLFSKGKTWLGRFGSIPNSDLVSGKVLKVSDQDKKLKDDPLLRGIPAGGSAIFAAVRACEKQMDRSLSGQTLFSETRLMFVTDSGAYFHYEACDICAATKICILLVCFQSQE